MKTLLNKISATKLVVALKRWLYGLATEKVVKQFIWEQTQEHRENFVKRVVELSEKRPLELSKYLIEHEMGCVYNYPKTLMNVTINYAEQNLRDILPRYNRELAWDMHKNLFRVQKPAANSI